MAYFFRHQLDGESNLNILLIQLCFVLMLVLAYKFRASDKLLKILLATGVILQLVLFVWYLGDHKLFVKEGLPLYHCRISMLMIATGYALGKPKLTRFFAWLGLIGAIISFTFPDPTPFLWPHVTNVTFVGVHYILGMTSLMLLSKSEEKLKYADCLKITLSMNFIILIVNKIMGSNYGYLRELPSMLNISISGLGLFICLTALIVNIIFVLNTLNNWIKNKAALKLRGEI